MKKYFKNSQVTKKQLLITLIAVAAIALLPFIIRSSYNQNVLCLIVIWSIVAMGWNVMGGYAGQVSIGHSAFFGIGAYAAAYFLKYCAITPWISIWFGVLASLVVALIIGAPLLRLKGHIFSVATMAMGECMRVIFVNWKRVNGAAGIDFLDKTHSSLYSLQFPTRSQYFYLFLGFSVVVFLIILFMDKSKFGYYLRTIKGNEYAAESVGIDTAKYKMYAYMLSAGICSVGGSLYACYLIYIDPSVVFKMNVSLMICLMTVMGGVGTKVGPLVGTALLICISEYTRVLFGGTGTGVDQILYGLLVIIAVLFFPDGIVSLVRKGAEKMKQKSLKKKESVIQ